MKSSVSKQLIVIGGPTAVGKSAIALRLAQHFQCEIVNADSRQVYRELQIGVNKPSKEDLELVPHHLIGHISIQDDYSVGRFEQDTLDILDQLFHKNDLAILVGGTGLYINAVLHGLDTFPTIPPDIKITVQDLMINQGLPGLQSFLQINDPEYFASMDQNNTRRLSRAMEVILTTGKKFSDLRQASIKPRQFEVLKYFVDDDRTQVYQRIDQRVDLMIKQGLKEEASSLFPFKHLKSLETVGYREWWHHFEGQCDQPTVIAKIKQHTRNYAKRQWTWWKPLQWPVINTNDLDQLIVEIERKLNNPYL